MSEKPVAATSKPVAATSFPSFCRSYRGEEKSYSVVIILLASGLVEPLSDYY